MTVYPLAEAPDLPLPARGERVGVRGSGNERDSRRAPLTRPRFARSTSPPKRGEGTTAPTPQMRWPPSRGEMIAYGGDERQQPAVSNLTAEEKIGQYFSLRREHVVAGECPRAAVPRRLEQRRDRRLGDEIGNEGSSIEARDLDRQRIVASHADRRRVDDETIAGRICRRRSHARPAKRPELPHQTLAPLGVDVADREFADAGLDERERNCGARPAGSDQKRTFAFGTKAALAQSGEQSHPVSHVPAPASVALASHHVDRGQKARAVGSHFAMRKCRELVRHRNDETIDVERALGRRYECGEVLGADVRWNANRIRRPLGKGAREPLG